MLKDTQGVSGPFDGADDIAAEDAARLRAELARKRATNRRHGNKGSRVWGYSTGSGRSSSRGRS